MSEKRTDDEVHVEARHSCRGENKTNDMKSTEMCAAETRVQSQWGGVDRWSGNRIGGHISMKPLFSLSFKCQAILWLSLRVFFFYVMLCFWFTLPELLIVASDVIRFPFIFEYEYVDQWNDNLFVLCINLFTNTVKMMFVHTETCTYSIIYDEHIFYFFISEIIQKWIIYELITKYII